MQLKSILIIPVNYTCADKYSITDFWGLFRSVNSLMFLNIDLRERSVLGWNLGPLAPQSVACSTDCHLCLRISICIQNINRMKYYRVSCIPFAQVLRNNSASVLPTIILDFVFPFSQLIFFNLWFHSFQTSLASCVSPWYSLQILSNFVLMQLIVMFFGLRLKLSWIVSLKKVLITRRMKNI